MLTKEEILENWHTHGALWLIEDPKLFENHEDAFVNAIKQCTNTQEHQTFLEDAAQLSVPRQIRQAVAENVNTPLKTLQKLMEDKVWVVRQAVAKNANTPADALQQLAGDEDYDVRKIVAKHVNAPIAALQRLMGDESWIVRSAVAENVNTPVELLQRLAQDKNWIVRCSVAENINARRVNQINGG